MLEGTIGAHKSRILLVISMDMDLKQTWVSIEVIKEGVPC